MTLWAEKLSPVVWNGPSGAWGDGAITSQGGVGAEEVVLHSVRARLTADATLATIFSSDRIEVVEFMNPYDSRDLPRIQVYPGTTDDSYAPTKLDIMRVRVIVGLKFDVSRDAGAGAVDPGKAMAAGVLRRCKTILRADANMHLTTPLGASGASAWLAQNMTMGSVRFSIYVVDSGTTALLELPVDYEVRVDNPTGVIFNILAANP